MDSDSTSNDDPYQTDNDSNGLDYQYQLSESDLTDISTGSETDRSAVSNVDVAPSGYDGVIDNIVRPNLSIKMTQKRKSKSEIWNYFGKLLYKQILVSKVSDKLYCKICFDENIFKRYIYMEI